MAAIKAGDVARVVASPRASYDGFLIYGSEASQTADLAHTLTRTLGVRSSPPGDIIRLSEQDIASDPARPAVELRTRPMFGGRPVIWLRGAAHLDLSELDDALSAPCAYLVIEAGALAKGAKLRQLFETRDNLAALPCYGDDAAAVSSLVESRLAEARLAAPPEARALLSEAFGSNLALARAEMEKLILYAHGERTLTPDLVQAALGDVAQGAIDDLVNATLAGAAGPAMVQMDRLKAGGFSSQAAIALLLVQLQRLLRLRAAMDGGMGFAEAARKLRPPLHFRQERAAAAQCRTWTASTLMDAIDRTLAAMRETRLNPALENILAERLLLDVAAIAAAAAGAPRAAQR